MTRLRTGGVRAALGAVLALALTTALAGCSSTGGKRAEDARKAAQAQGRAAVDTPAGPSRW